MKKALIGFLIIMQSTLYAYTDGDESVKIYVGKGVTSGLGEVMAETFDSNKIEYAPTYIYSISYAKTIFEPFEHIHFGYEGDIAKHTGLQENYEVGAVIFIMLRALLPDNSFIDFDFNSGIGLSHAIGSPSFENGPTDNPAKRYNTQLFLTFDYDFYLPTYPDVHFYIRKHHRSGAGGVVAPAHVGSNFLGYGLRFIY